MSENGKNPISELQVTGHTMALEPGIYCVFSAPGSTPPISDTGLPTVRISAAPGPVAGVVDVVGLDGQGWITPTAATLVRINGARSNVLVTVYQAKGSKADAPQIQVMRISAPPEEAPLPKAIAPPIAAIPATAAALAASAALSPKQGPQEVTAVAHIYGRGDVGGSVGAWVGEPGSKRWIEGFGLAPVGIVPTQDIEYQALLGRGWLSPWSQGGQFCGSRSMSLPILGLRVRLRGDAAKTHHIKLEATFIDGSRIGPVGDGDPCEADSLAALEAFCVSIEERVPSPRRAKAAVRGAEPAIPEIAKKGGKAKAAVAPVTNSKPAVAAKEAAKAKPAPSAVPKVAPPLVKTAAAKPKASATRRR